MMNEKQVKKLLEDIETVYLTSYERKQKYGTKFENEAELWGQIQILEWVLLYKEDNKRGSPKKRW